MLKERITGRCRNGICPFCEGSRMTTEYKGVAMCRACATRLQKVERCLRHSGREAPPELR